MLDAVLGLINIEQNEIVKIFTVAAVVFMPPTLIASIYGMNFAHMPGLENEYGYYISLVSCSFPSSCPWFTSEAGACFERVLPQNLPLLPLKLLPFHY